LKSLTDNIHGVTAEISGIQLTRYILEKLFFSYHIEPDKWCGHGINIEKEPDGFYYGLTIQKNRSQIEYLHQLQLMCRICIYFSRMYIIL